MTLLKRGFTTDAILVILLSFRGIYVSGLRFLHILLLKSHIYIYIYIYIYITLLKVLGAFCRLYVPVWEIV